MALHAIDRRMSLWDDVLLFLAIVLVPFQDMSWQHWVVGELLKTPATIPIFLLLISKIFRQTACLKFTIRRDLLYMCSYCVFISIASILIFGSAIGPINTFTRTAAILLEYGLFLFVVYGIDYRASRLLKPAIYCAIAITIFAVLTSDYSFIPGISLGGNSTLHATLVEHPDGRWRGFTQEPSFFSVLSFTLVGCLVTITTKAKRSVWTLVVLIVLLLGCGSKGGILSAVFAFMIAGGYVLGKNKNKLYVALLAACSPLVLAGVYLAVTVLFPMTLITESTTVPTRLTSFVWSIEESATHPFGVGIAGFIVKAEEDTGRIESSLQQLSPVRLDFEEIDTSLATYTDLSTKSILLNGTVWFGWLFAIFTIVKIVNVSRSLQRQRDWAVFTFWIMTVCAIGSYVDSLVLYNVPLFLGIVRAWNIRYTPNAVALE